MNSSTNASIHGKPFTAATSRIMGKSSSSSSSTTGKQFNAQYLGMISTPHEFPKFGEWSAQTFREKICDVLEKVRLYSECTRECDIQKVGVKLSVDPKGTVHAIHTKNKDSLLNMPVSDIMSFKAQTFIIKGKKKTFALLCAKKRGISMDTIACYRFAFKNRVTDEKGFFENLRIAFQNVHVITGVPSVWQGTVAKRPSEIAPTNTSTNDTNTTNQIGKQIGGQTINYDTNC